MRISLIPILLILVMVATIAPDFWHARKARPTPVEPLEPRSLVEPEGDQYAAFDDRNDNLHYTTTTKPVPRDAADRPSGAPVYHWDFGPLHGKDNGDGSAIIYTDVEGSYKVRAYCEQAFIDADGTVYTERTLTSD